MSMWTHIVASLDVDTYVEVDDIEAYVKSKLRYAPKITGSERDAAVFVNAKPGYSCSTNRDCARCFYKGTGDPECGAPVDYKCPEGSYQTRVVITVAGDLRDREFEETLHDWLAFKLFIEGDLEWNVRNYSCRIR